MTALRKSLWTIAAIAALPAPAAAQEICNAMNRIVAAARETPRFASVQRALANGEAIVPGFSADRCRADDKGVECSLFQRSDQRVDWRQEISCPGLTQVAPLAGAETGRTAIIRRLGRQTRVYTGFGLRISLGLDCVGCAMPSTSYFRAALDQPGRPGQ